MRIFIAVLFLIFSFQSLTKADDISDFEIAGMSIGDSLLDYMSEKEIKEGIERTRDMYQFTTDEFEEVYKYDGLQTYFYVSFFVKPDDKNFIIYGINGGFPHEKDINSCYKKMSEISKEFSATYKNAKKNEDTFNNPGDPTGRSKMKQVNFIFKSGDKIKIVCTDFEENFRIKNNLIDGLDIIIQSKEVTDWLSKRIN